MSQALYAVYHSKSFHVKKHRENFKHPGAGRERSSISILLKAGVDPINAQDRDWKTDSKSVKKIRRKIGVLKKKEKAKRGIKRKRAPVKPRAHSGVIEEKYEFSKFPEVLRKKRKISKKRFISDSETTSIFTSEDQAIAVRIRRAIGEKKKEQTKKVQ